LPVPRIISSTMRKKNSVYPVYDLKFQEYLTTVEEYLSGFHRLIPLGRQGLFVHDNTHHTIEMGIAAGKCLDESLNWDSARWMHCRKSFEEHIVVD